MPPVALRHFGSLPLLGPVSLQLAQIKTQLALHQLNAIVGTSVTPPSIASPALTLHNLLKVTMSHPLYNPRGGPFPSGQRPVVPGQYGLGSQPRMQLGQPLGCSISVLAGGLLGNQPFSLGQRQSQISPDLEAAIGRNLRGAREEVRLLTQMLQQPKKVDPRMREDEVLPSGSGFSATSRSDEVGWSMYQAPSKLFTSSSLDRDSGSSQLFPSASFVGGSSGLDSQPPPEQRPSRYTSESAGSILASFGLSSEDLELLSHYPDDQLTPDNLPFILRDIRMRKAKRDIDARSEYSKVIDYGHSSTFDYPEESPDSYASKHLPKESPKFMREVSGQPFIGMDITKHHQARQPAPGPVQVPKLQKPPPVDPRPTKTIPARPPSSQPILHPVDLLRRYRLNLVFFLWWLLAIFPEVRMPTGFRSFHLQSVCPPWRGFQLRPWWMITQQLRQESFLTHALYVTLNVSRLRWVSSYPVVLLLKAFFVVVCKRSHFLFHLKCVGELWAKTVLNLNKMSETCNYIFV